MEKSPGNVFDEGKMLLIDKPLNWTSFDVVRKIRNLVRTKKVGHAGTLDPLATGLLILCTGKFTKRINDYMAREKEYTGDFTFGATTPTYDLESDPQDHKDFGMVTAESLAQILPRFTGDFLQVPPMHSAIKKDGKRLYELARKGKDIRPEPRKVSISEFVITGVELPVVHFRVVCSTGTYIRSLAKDMGDAAGCGAYLSRLCRTRIGDFTLDQAMSIGDAEAYIREELGTVSHS
ncbi:MAG: tRNA pseudouridine(55) synthase TruB [Puia sp.]|nr:tRNA pseudouridine(55) synthase TruB [Puia sp.]